MPHQVMFFQLTQFQLGLNYTVRTLYLPSSRLVNLVVHPMAKS